ncbi:MAG: thioredoxin family protein [Candidatus Aminicenantes bacterium]|nr:thioredoxin family protein [Candidatus Aminicenantes bacterium]
MGKKIMFWARECPHCKNMMPLVDRLIDEEGIEIEKLEIWHNEENADLMRSYKDVIAPKCGGQLRTPTFFDTETNDVICGEVEYEVLKEWALK